VDESGGVDKKKSGKPDLHGADEELAGVLEVDDSQLERHAAHFADGDLRECTLTDNSRRKQGDACRSACSHFTKAGAGGGTSCSVCGRARAAPVTNPGETARLVSPAPTSAASNGSMQKSSAHCPAGPSIVRSAPGYAKINGCTVKKLSYAATPTGQSDAPVPLQPRPAPRG